MQVKYPQLNIQNENQEIPQYQPAQTFNDSQPSQSKNPDFIYVPVLVNQNQNPQHQNTLYQPILPYQNQVVPYSNVVPYQNAVPQNQPLQNFQQPQASKMISDADFSEQKGFLIGIILLFILWSIIYLFCILLLLGAFAETMKQANFIYICLFIFFLIIMFVVNSLSVQKKNRNSSTLLYFVSILLQILVSFFFIGYAASTTTHDYLSLALLIVIGIYTCQIAHFISTVVMLFYLLIEQKELSVGKFAALNLITLLIIFVIFSKFLIYLIFFIPFSIPYIFILPNSLLQITRGRFKLQKGEVFAGALAANFSLYVCCGQEE